MMTKKTAGVLQVPEKLLADIQDWMVATFAQSLFYHFEALAKHRKNRLIEFDMMKTAYEKSSILISSMLRANFPEEETNLYIPHFENKYDDLTNTSGIVDRHKDSFAINIKPLPSANKIKMYDFYLQLPTVSLGPQPMTKVGIIKKLQELKDLIELTFTSAKEFIDEYFQVEDEDEIKENEFIKNVCRRLASKPGPQNMFEVKIKDLPYYNGMNTQHSYIKVKTIFSNMEKSKRNGYWSPKEITASSNLIGEIAVIRDVREIFRELKTRPEKALQALNDIIDDIKRTTRHEMQHFMQDAIQYMSGSKNEAGLPGYDIRDKSRDPGGFPSAPDDETMDQRMDRYKKQAPHELRDREFYTRISDEIHYFNIAKSSIPNVLHRLLLLAWVDQIAPQVFKDAALMYMKVTILKKHPEADFKYPQQANYQYLGEQAGSIYSIWPNLPRKFFTALKNGQPEKFQKAVKEFIKGVS